MNKYISLLFVSLFMGSTVFAANLLPSDTTIRFNNKLIKVTESNDQLKVKVYENGINNDTIPYKQLYEGIFSDGKSYEKWTVQEAIGFEFPFLNKHKKTNSTMHPHWAGFGIGFANITDHSLNMTNVNGLAIKADQSTEWFINLFQHILPIYQNNLGITTGLGMSWLNLHLDNNTHLVDVNGVTGVYDAPAGINYSLSRLMVVHLTLPLLLEWQPTFGTDHRSFLSAGIVAGVKTFSSYKVQYTDNEGNAVTKVEAYGLNTTPLSLDFMAQAGYGSFSVYAKYSPFSIFQANKGPDVKAVSLGLMLHF
jgi:hypothetical protein